MNSFSTRTARGLAIVAVLIIHYLAGLKGYVFAQGVYQFQYIFLDQSLRFCVPLFIVLSGYGLAKKYGSHIPNYKDFLTRRVSKLLPVYLLWSIFYLTFLPRIPAWYVESATQETSLFGLPWQILKPFLLGKADYQLYFIPLILQLYLLFPVILWAWKQRRMAVFTLAGLWQIWLYWYIEKNLIPSIKPVFFGSDGAQYIWFFSWLWYFVLGVWLAQSTTSRLLAQFNVLGYKILGWGTLGGLLWSSAQTYMSILDGTDPLLALRFTKLPVLMYSTFFCISIFLLCKSSHNTKKNSPQLGATNNSHLFEKKLSLTRYKKALVAFVTTILSKLGDHSYTLFFAHTLGLRIWFGWYYQTVSLSTLILASCALVSMYTVSRFMESKLAQKKL